MSCKFRLLKYNLTSCFCLLIFYACNTIVDSQQWQCFSQILNQEVKWSSAVTKCRSWGNCSSNKQVKWLLYIQKMWEVKMVRSIWISKLFEIYEWKKKSIIWNSTRHYEHHCNREELNRILLISFLQCEKHVEKRIIGTDKWYEEQMEGTPRGGKR